VSPRKVDFEWATFRKLSTYLNMRNLRGPVLVGGAIWALGTACTTEDSLLDAAGNGGAGRGSGGGASQGGSIQTTGGQANRGGSVSTSGGSPASGGKLAGDAGSGGVGEPAGSPSNGGEAPATGGQSAGTAGAGPSGGSSGAGGAGGSEVCSDATTLDACEALDGCHAVFVDMGVCGCDSVGCCTRFSACAPGEKADCEGRSVQCDAMTPSCEDPVYVVSYSGWCYEGCVDPKDCGACGDPEDPNGCLCYSDQDCAQGSRCYGADCGSETPGTCRTPPTDGCFGDADCPGQACIGGRPSRCNTALPDVIGTCTTEACPDGDCLGSTGPDCTCSDGNQCVAATGPGGSGLCRDADGTCLGCVCAAPDTPIATPAGERTIASLQPGDLVYSVDGAGIRAVKILRVNRVPVFNHHVLRVAFDNGRTIDMTAGHPLADGRPLSALRPGSELVGANVVSVTEVPYGHDATYDILPDSTSGAYFASGVLIGSTLTGTARGVLEASPSPSRR
jgi:hypothetical protein